MINVETEMNPTIEAQAEQASVGEVIVRLLEHWGVTYAFGVISIHNMPILDPLGVRDNIRFVAARGEAGGLNMADAYARVSGSLGVAFTSTGTAAGNAAGAMVEALTAGSPVMHITGQVELEHLDRDRAYIHEAPRQLEMLQAISKAAFRISSPDELVATMVEAATVALSAPTGPVSIEIPVDVQAALMSVPAVLPEIERRVLPTAQSDIDALAAMLRAARRPMVLLGGGARGAEAEATQLADLGVPIVTSTNGRGIVPEMHPLSLGAFNCTPQIQALYEEADLLIVAGSRLRGNETWTYKLRLPARVAVIDCDVTADGRTYSNDLFVHGDVRTALAGLVDAAAEGLEIEPAFVAKITAAREAMPANLRAGLGDYAELVDAVQAAIPAEAAWVRDVTISNSTWGNRYLRVGHSRAGVHAVGGGIGQGLPMAIGAALASPAGAFALSGDGGLSLCLGELMTLAQEQPDVTLILMNDLGYGVIRNIQDVEYGARKLFSNILIPDFGALAVAMGLRHEKVSDVGDVAAALARARSKPGAAIIEVDMVAIGPYPVRFAGPPKLAK